MEIFDLHLVKKVKEYNSIYTLSFSCDTPITFTAGQWAHLGFPSGEKDKTRIRHMSFSSAPGDQYLEFTMDLGTGTWFKNEVASLEPKDTIKAFKIKGEFVISPSETDEIIFIVGGIGVTPVRSILHDYKNMNKQFAWKLLHVSRDEFLYENEIKQYENEQWRTNRQGLASLWEKIVQDSSKRKYYVCGSDRFVNGLSGKLLESNIAPEKIIRENFDDQ